MTIKLKDYEDGAPFEGDYEQTLADLQETIARQVVSLHIHGKRALVAFEGWDAAGKGGAIQRLTAQCDPRHFKVWPISAPSPAEKAHHYLWRFWTRLPADGEMAVFDRSWYGRVLVERVEGFAPEAAWRRGYDEINEFEASHAADGTIIVKLFFHVTQKTQDKRLKERLADPWKRWKISAEDFRNRGKREGYLDAIHDMFAETSTRWAPWTVIDGNNKKAARIAALRAVSAALAPACPSVPPPLNEDVQAAADGFLKETD